MPPADDERSKNRPTLNPLAGLARLWTAASWSRYIVLASAATIVAIAVVTALAGPIHARVYGHDIFFLLDNGWRALHGQRVHVDYSSSWGPVTFLIVAGGMAVSSDSVAAVSYGSAFVGLVVGLWALWLSAARSRTLSVLFFPSFVTLMATAPFPVGVAPTYTSHAMVYNRYGYAVLGAVMLSCFQMPVRSVSSTRLLVEAGVTGCAIGVLLFLKITYFLAALPIVGLSLWLWDSRQTRLVGYLAGGAATALCFLAYLHFDVQAMFGDLWTAAAARSGGVGHRDNIYFPLAALSALLLAIPVGGCAWLGRDHLAGRPMWHILRLPLAGALAVMLDIAFLLTNAQPSSYPVTTTCAAVLLFPIDAWLGSRQQQRLAAILLLAAVMLAGPILAAEGAGLVRSAIETRLWPVPPDVARFESPRLRPLVLHDFDGPDFRSNGRVYVSLLNDGIRLLESHTSPADKIATLDMFNPFAYALNRPPIRGGIAAAAYQYTINDGHHPSADRYFADADVLMVPKIPATAAVFYDGFKRIYDPAIEQLFVPAAESMSWRLYRRRAITE